MDKNIDRLFNHETIEKRFTKLKISLASPEKIKSWSFVEKNPKQLITELLDQKKMVCSVRGFLAPLKIMNVYAVNIKE